MDNNQSFDLLFNKFHLVSQKALWVLDENPPQHCPVASANIEVISNRFDVVEHMISLGYQATFSDFDFRKLIQYSYQFVFYRISKEKMLAHYILNQARTVLSDDGQLVISGAKQEGIKGYIDRCATLYPKVDTYKADKQHWAAIFKQSTEVSVPLDDKNYLQLRLINEDQPVVISNESLEDDQNFRELPFFSKPGIFGWHKIDQGSLLLAQNLTAIYKAYDLVAPKTAIDLGCGYGYLSLHCANAFQCHMTATDNNAAAVLACAHNLAANKMPHTVVATNCADAISNRFDLVVCNPPFHSGFQVENDLTNLFIEGAKKCMSNSAIAIFVVNLHIPLERKAAVHFKNVHTFCDNNHFKVVVLDNR